MFGNGDTSGGSGQRDQIDRELDRLDSAIVNLTVERETIAALSYAAGDDYATGSRLAAQDAQAGIDLAAAYDHQTGLLNLRRQAFEETPGGGMIFGLGILPAVIAAVAAAIAAVSAYIAYVLNAMDSRRNERQTIREQLVASGQAPPSILNTEPGVLAGITGAIGTAGMWIAIGLALYMFGGRRGRR